VSAGRVSGPVAAFLDAAGVPYDAEDGGARLRISFADGDTGLAWTCLAYCLDDEARLVVFSTAPEDVPPLARPAVLEYLARVNHGLILGGFEMDLEDGEVRCRTSVEFGGVPPVPDLIRPVIAGNLGLMRRYLPGLLSVAAGAAEPADAAAAGDASTAEAPAL
jgi:hypothetical protein